MRPETRHEMVELRDGWRAVLRPIEPDEEATLVATFERLSPESRYRRFFRPIERLSTDELAHLMDVDHRDHEAIIAIDPESGDGLGVARYVRLHEDAQRAEAAVAVVDDWQGRGLGRALLERLADRAREEDVRRFSALVQADNRRAVQLLSSLGCTRSELGNGTVELDIELPASKGLGSDLAEALRAAAGSIFSFRGLWERLGRRARELYEGRTAPAPERSGLHGPIVVGTDGSEGASRAVRSAGELAGVLGADLHIVTAYHPVAERRLRQELAEAPSVHHVITPHEDADAIVESAAALLRGGGVEARTHARVGDPAEVIINVAEDVGAALIIVGNRGMKRASRFLLGSVPNTVSHHAPCSVMVARTVE